MSENARHRIATKSPNTVMSILQQHGIQSWIADFDSPSGQYAVCFDGPSNLTLDFLRPEFLPPLPEVRLT